MAKLSRNEKIQSFAWLHVYLTYFDCEYDGIITWTGNLSFDLKVIEVLPVLYPEQVREPSLK